jgi:hypothetical protein
MMLANRVRRLHQTSRKFPNPRPVKAMSVDPDTMNLIGSIVRQPGIRLLAEGITTFTMIYCTLNWLEYRNIRMKQDAADQDDD